MNWLWIDHPRFTVRVELDKNDDVATLPPILYKRFKGSIGQSWKYLQILLEHDYKNKAIVQFMEDKPNG